MKDKLSTLLALVLLYGAVLPFIFLVGSIFAAVKKIISFNNFSKNKLLILPAFFPGNAGYHWRVETWINFLQEAGIQTKECLLWDERSFLTYQVASSPTLQLYYITKRCVQIIYFSFQYDRIWVRRESVVFADIGFRICERLQKMLYKERILDFDDDIAEAKKEPIKRSWMGKLLGISSRPFSCSLPYYNRFTVGNKVLKEKLKIDLPQINFDRDVLVLSTCYKVIPSMTKDYSQINTKIIIGWLGSNGNQYVLDAITDELNTLYERYPFELRVVSGRAYQNSKALFPIENRPWSLETERHEMLEFDIGIMPLTGRNDDSGKSAFKLIQYMSMGLISAASPHGMNSEVLNHGVNGFIIRSGEGMWRTGLEEILSSKAKWTKISQRAKQTIELNYSFKSNEPKLLQFLSITGR